MSETEAPALEGEQEALVALLASEGWARFLRYAQENHGPEASIRAIDRALQGLDRGDDGGVRDTVQQIRASARAVDRLIAWPTERVQQIHQQRASSQARRFPFRRSGA